MTALAKQCAHSSWPYHHRCAAVNKPSSSVPLTVSVPWPLKTHHVGGRRCMWLAASAADILPRTSTCTCTPSLAAPSLECCDRHTSRAPHTTARNIMRVAAISTHVLFKSRDLCVRSHTRNMCSLTSMLALNRAHRHTVAHTHAGGELR